MIYFYVIWRLGKTYKYVLYLDVTHENSIESINRIKILYEDNISKLTYDAKCSLA